MEYRVTAVSPVKNISHSSGKQWLRLYHMLDTLCGDHSERLSAALRDTERTSISGVYVTQWKLKVLHEHMAREATTQLPLSCL